MIKTSFILNQFYEVLQQRIEALKEIDRLKERVGRKDIIIKRCRHRHTVASPSVVKISRKGIEFLDLPFEPEDADELVQLAPESQ